MASVAIFGCDAHGKHRPYVGWASQWRGLGLSLLKPISNSESSKMCRIDCVWQTACILDVMSLISLKFCLHCCMQNKTAELSQRRPRDAPNIWVHWKVLRVLTTHPTTFPEICNGLLFRSILRMCVQNLKFVALPVREIIGVLKKFRQSLDTPTLHFLPKF